MTRLDVTWTSETDDEAVQSTSWRFDRGAAPRSLFTTVRLPSGAYGVELSLERNGDEGSEPSKTTERRPIRVDGEQVRIFLH